MVIGKLNIIKLEDYIEIPIAIGGSSEKLVLENRFSRERYIVKSQKLDNKTNSPYNDHIAEFLGSNIIKLLGYESQKAYLVQYNDLITVAVKMFDFELKELSNECNYFYSMEESFLDLDKILSEYRTHSYTDKFDEEKFKRFLVQMLLVDYVIVNIDRHPGNIGFREVNGILVPAPFYDAGASLLTRYFFKDYQDVIENHKLVNYKVRLNNKRITFEQSLEQLSESTVDYKKEIRFLLENYDKNREEIFKLIESIQDIDNRYKNIIPLLETLLEMTTSELRSIINESNQISWI